MKMRRVLTLVLVLVVAFSLVGCKDKQAQNPDTGGHIDKQKEVEIQKKYEGAKDQIKDTTGKIGDVVKDVGDIIDSGRTIVDEINKIGDVVDPKMNPNYVALKTREIGRALEEYQEAKRRYEDTGWYRPFARSSRKKEMERAKQEYLDKVEAFSQAKVDFDYDVYQNTSGYMIWRKPARKNKWQNSLRNHSEFLLNCADHKLRKAQQEYDDASWIFFWNKLGKKKKLEQAKADYDSTLEYVERLWADAGLLAGSGLKTREVMPPSEVQPGEDVQKLGVDTEGDM